MIKGTKIRGSDRGLNLIIIDGVFHKVSPELVSYEMILTKSDIPNIYCIGYSKHFRQLFIQFRNDRRYIYQNVPIDKWQLRHNYEKLNQYWVKEIQGIGYYETEEYVRPVTNEYVLEAYNKLEYWQTITDGLWCTDRPDKVIDTGDVLFQLDAD